MQEELRQQLKEDALSAIDDLENARDTIDSFIDLSTTKTDKKKWARKVNRIEDIISFLRVEFKINR